MNIKKATISQLSSIKLKQTNNLSKQPEQEQNHRYAHHLEGYQLAGERGRIGGKVTGNKKHNW